MHFDEILERIGSFGKYQKIKIFLLCIPHITCGIYMVISVLLLGIPEHRCKIPEYENDTFKIQGVSHQSLVEQYIPKSSDKTKEYDQCHLFSHPINNSFNGSTYFGNLTGNASMVKCDEWVYDTDTFKETFVSKHNIVCSEDHLLAFTKMMFFAGVMVGAFFFGNLADRIGRKSAMSIALVTQVASSIGLAWAPNLIVYIILRFFIGASTNGVVLTSFVLSMELVGPSQRVIAGNLNGYFFGTGEVIVAGLGYFIRDWYYIEIIAGCAAALCLPVLWFIPESPRWLLNRGRTRDAEYIIERISLTNGKELQPNELQNYKENKRAEGKIWHLFTSKVLLTRTLIIFFNWCVVSMNFFGLSMNSGNLGGNFYLNFFLSGLVDYPAVTLTILLLNRIGRKNMHFACMTTGGVACLATIFTTTFGGKSLNILTVILAMIGKMGAGAAFGTIFVFSTELYPTAVRNAGMGASSCAARVGSMVSPYIINLAGIIGGTTGKAIPLVIFGSASIVAGLLVLFLPETLNKSLPDSLEDGKKFGTSSSNLKNKEANVNSAFSANDEVRDHV